MKKILLFAIIVLLQKASIYAQTFDGTVKDSKTNEALAYVNVGIIGKAIGTVTDTAGHFKLTLSNNDSDSLRISMIGYIPKTYLVKDFAIGYMPDKAIMLTPSNHELAEVKISARKL